MPALALDPLLVTLTARVFLVFGILGFVVGIGLIVSSTHMHAFSHIMNHWVSMRRSTKWLAIPRDIGPALQRFPRALGAACVLLAVFSTIVLLTQTDLNRIVAALDNDSAHPLVAWLVESAYWLLIAGSVVAVIVGLMLLFFPAALRALEARANHWYSLRNLNQGGDTMRLGFDLWVENYPRTLGSVIATGSLVVVVNYGMLLLASG